MSTSTKPVDLLAVISRDMEHAAAYRLAHGYADGTLVDAVTEAHEARAAIIDLIEAASEILCEVRDRSCGKARLRDAIKRARGEA